MRRIGIEFLQHAGDFFQFRHQSRFVLQSSRGVDQQDVGAVGASPAAKASKASPAASAPGAPRNHRRAGAVAPYLELFDGGGAKCIARGEG